MEFTTAIGEHLQRERNQRSLELSETAFAAQLTVPEVEAIEAGAYTEKLYPYIQANHFRLGSKVFIEHLWGDPLLPKRGTGGSAGYDLCVRQPEWIPSGGQVLIKLGFKTLFDSGLVGLIRDRSGLALKKRVTTRAGVIDSDYNDEWGVVLCNEGKETVSFAPGDRVAQVLFVHVAAAELEKVANIIYPGTRDGGFGSTGR